MKRALVLITFLAFLTPVWGASLSCFIIVSENASLDEIQAQILDLGGTVRFQVPPRIIAADFPPGKDPAQIKNVQKIYSGFVPLDGVANLGPVAISAGQQWNQNQASASQQMGKMSFQSATSQFATAFISEPKNITLHIESEGSNLAVVWDPVFGADIYLIQISPVQDFSSLLVQSYTEMPSANLPITIADKGTLFIRVRGLEKLRAGIKSENILGNWASAEIQVPPTAGRNENLPAPQLTSPSNGYQSQGPNLSLEWTSQSNGPKRIQISDSDNFKTPLIDAVVSGGEFNCPSTALQIGQVYFWRVKEWGGGASSPWSSSGNFVVGEPRQIDGDMMRNPEAPR